MKASPLTLTLAAVLAATSVTPAAAQYVDPAADARYRDQVDDYNDRVRDYEAKRGDYEERRSDYADNRAEYERQRADYEAKKADYDRRYGWGSYERRYGAFVYQETYSSYDDGYRYRGYDRDYYSAYRDSPCERSRDRRTGVGALIGALAGAAIGSNVDDDGNRAEGTVLGALVGGALGAGVGRSTAACDNAGYYYSYAQTYPYREARYYRGGRSGRYDSSYYQRQRCRLAVAPTEFRGRTEYRYVRVCPDRRGRYRITD